MTCYVGEIWIDLLHILLRVFSFFYTFMRRVVVSNRFNSNCSNSSFISGIWVGITFCSMRQGIRPLLLFWYFLCIYLIIFLSMLWLMEVHATDHPATVWIKWRHIHSVHSKFHFIHEDLKCCGGNKVTCSFFILYLLWPLFNFSVFCGSLWKINRIFGYMLFTFYLKLITLSRLCFWF